MLLFQISYSQERIDEIRPILSKQFHTITKIDGWEFNENSGKWIKTINNVGVFDCISLDFRKISIDYKNYFALTIKQKDGAYQYPTIKKGWREWVSYRTYIFNEYDFQELKKYKSIYSKFYEVNTLNDFYDKFDLISLSNGCYNSIKTGEKQDLNFCFAVKNVDGKKIRFLLPFSRGDEFLKDDYDFDKCYFEVDILEFNKLINDTNLQK